jgi:DNA replication protein DnaC
VLFTRTTDLVQKLQIARRDLVLEAAIAKLDKYHLLILDDLAYVTKDQAETSVLFELISARYVRIRRRPSDFRMRAGTASSMMALREGQAAC